MDADELLLTLADTAGHARHITAAGDLDVSSSAQLATMIDELIQSGVTLIVLDLTAVGFADSSGLRVIVHAGNQLEAHDGRLIIEGVSPAVGRLLELTGLIDRYRHVTENNE